MVGGFKEFIVFEFVLNLRYILIQYFIDSVNTYNLEVFKP
jgi:hypothetical protein